MSSIDLVSGLHNIKSTDVVSNVYDIEDVLVSIRDLEDKVDYFKGLKQHRAKAIDQEIEKATTLADTLRSVVLNSMKQLAPDKKTLSFPSVGKTTRRKPSEGWQVDDERTMLTFLDQQGVKQQVIKEVKEVVDKKQLNNVLDFLDQSGKVVPGVSKKEGDETLSISFDKEFRVPEAKQLDNQPHALADAGKNLKDISSNDI